MIFHVLNRGVGRREIFREEEDFAAFERVMGHALQAVRIDLLLTASCPITGIFCCVRGGRGSWRRSWRG